jgi:hypothetical protein
MKIEQIHHLARKYNKIIHENDFLYETSSNLKFLSFSLIMTHDEISFFLS